MVVKNRIAYIRQMLHFGAKITVTVTSNPDTGVEKFKVIIDPGVQVPVCQQFFVSQVLELLDRSCETHNIADKGHKHSQSSGGKSEVHFYVTPRVPSKTLTGNMNLNPAAATFIPAKGSDTATHADTGHDHDVFDAFDADAVTVDPVASASTSSTVVPDAGPAPSAVPVTVSDAAPTDDVLDAIRAEGYCVYNLDGPQSHWNEKKSIRFCVDKLLYYPSDAERLNLDAAEVLRRIRAWRQIAEGHVNEKKQQ